MKNNELSLGHKGALPFIITNIYTTYMCIDTRTWLSIRRARPGRRSLRYS
jgi:hypothetical protein